MRVLLIEDDRHLAWAIKNSMAEKGYAVDCATNGQDGIDMAAIYPYDLIILDIMLPDINGFIVCKEIRKQGMKTPILMLTARYREEDKVRGLDSGADDYMVKPFGYPELYARARALVRRSKNECLKTIEIGELILDTALKRVLFHSDEIHFTAKEYEILEYLMYNKNGIVTKGMIEEHIWDCEHGAFSNVIEVLISRIRRKLCSDDREAVIKTVVGLGYTIEDKKIS